MSQMLTKEFFNIVGINNAHVTMIEHHTLPIFCVTIPSFYEQEWTNDTRKISLCVSKLFF